MFLLYIWPGRVLAQSLARLLNARSLRSLAYFAVARSTSIQNASRPYIYSHSRSQYFILMESGRHNLEFRIELELESFGVELESFGLFSVRDACCQ
jgi:hypothetical protein